MGHAQPLSDLVGYCAAVNAVDFNFAVPHGELPTLSASQHQIPNGTFVRKIGIVAPVGRRGVTELLHIVADPGDKRVPEVARACLAALGTQLLRLKQQILEFDRMIMAWHRSNQTSKRLHYIPGVGPILATALVASVADPR